MKIGSFVGKKILAISNAEKVEIKNRIVALCDKVFGTGNYKIVETKIDTGFVHYCVEPTIFNVNDKFALRLTDGSQAKFDNILFSINKSKGYDENVEGKFYEIENFNPKLNLESYAMRVSVFGDYKGYRKKNTEMNVGMMYQGKALWSYTYGTELDDLFDDKVSSILELSVEAIKTGKKTKNVLTYW